MAGRRLLGLGELEARFADIECMAHVGPPSVEYAGRPPEGARAGLGAARRSARFMHREKTPVLDVPFSVVFAPFVLFIAVIGVQYVIKFARLLGRDWEEHL